MALLINEDCTACDACEPVCPNDAISVGDPIYVINPLACTECVGAEDEPQCKLVCPADCIVQRSRFRRVSQRSCRRNTSRCTEPSPGTGSLARRLGTAAGQRLLRRAATCRPVTAW